MTERNRFRGSAVSIDTISVLTLFAVFTVSLLFVLLSGASVYKDTVAAMTDTYGQRTIEAYLISKVRHGDGTAADGTPLVRIIDADGTDVLAITEEYYGVQSVTYVYWHDGYVRELYIDADAEFDPSLGEKIVTAESLSMKYRDSQIEFSVGGNDPLLVSLRSDK